MALRIPEEEESEEGGGYLVSVSDLMIGLLFVFLLMLMAFALQFVSAEKQQHELIQQQRAQAEILEQKLDRQRRQVGNDLKAEIDRIHDALTSAQTLRDALLNSLQERLRREGILVQIVPASGILRLQEGVLFGSLRSDLTEQRDPSLPTRLSSREVVRRLAAALAEIVPCYADGGRPQSNCPAGSALILEAIFVEGHTDSRNIAPGGRLADNYQLSTERALSTYRALIADRPSLVEIKNTTGGWLFGLSGYGADRPVQSGDREEDMALNRRIDLRFLLAAPPPQGLEALRRSLNALTEPAVP